MEERRQDSPAAPAKKTWKSGCGLLAVGLFAVALVGSLMDGGTKVATKPTGKVAEKAKEPDGFSCLSKWDGSHRKLVDELKRTLRNPDSFKHIETRLAPSKTSGEFVLFMDYRAENGFGGMAVGKLAATMKQDCSFTVDANVNQ